MTPADRRHLAEWATLRSFAQTLNQTLDLRTALEAALSHILELTGLEAGWIYLRDEGDQFTLAARQHLLRRSIIPVWHGKANALVKRRAVRANCVNQP